CSRSNVNLPHSHPKSSDTYRRTTSTPTISVTSRSTFAVRPTRSCRHRLLCRRHALRAQVRHTSTSTVWHSPPRRPQHPPEDISRQKATPDPLRRSRPRRKGTPCSYSCGRQGNRETNT